MFGSKTRRIAALEKRNARLTEQRDYHQHRADTAQAVTTRTAAKFAATHELNEFLNDQAHGYQELLTRHGRLLRACFRYREEIAFMKRRLREKDEHLEALQTALDGYHEREFQAAKAGMTAAKSRRSVKAAA